MEQKSSDDDSGKQPTDNPSKSNKEEEIAEDAETPTYSFDKRKLEVKEQKYASYAAVDATKISVAVSPTKRKCTEINVSPRKIELEETLIKADKPAHENSATGVDLIKGSPKRSQRITGSPFTPLQLQQLSSFSSSFHTSTSVADTMVKRSAERSLTTPGTCAISGSSQRSPKISPTKPGASAAGAVVQRSPKLSPTKPGTYVGGAVVQGSPKRSAMKSGTSAAGGTNQRSPKLSPTRPETSVAVSVSQGSPKLSTMKPGTEAVGLVMQGSPKHSQTKSSPSAADAVIKGSQNPSQSIPGPSSSGAIIPGSPNPSQSISGPSASGAIIPGSPNRSPAKRTYKEKFQSCSSDYVVEKRIKEGSGYQSDSALDLRKDFKKKLPSSTQSPEIDCLPTSSENIGIILEKQSEEKSVQSSCPRDSKSTSRDVTSSDGGEEEVSSTSNESVAKSTDKEASPAHGLQKQNVTEENKKEISPRASPQRSDARPKEAVGRSRSEEYIQVSCPKYSPSKLFYGEPIIRRISPQRSSPSGSGSHGCFKVPPPPPPLEEREIQPRITNALEGMHSLIVDCYAIVTAEQLREQTRKEKEEKMRRQQEQAENFARAKVLAQETTKRLREKEARLKESGNKSGTVPDEAVAGPSTSPDLTRGYGPEENVEAPAITPAKPQEKEEHKSINPVAQRENLPAAQQSMHDDSANTTESQSQIASQDDASNKPSTSVPNEQESKDDDAKPITSTMPA